VRERLPEIRKGITRKFVVYTRDGQEIDGYITTGVYEDGRLGEIFVTVGKMGDSSRLIDSWAKAVSVLLQQGTPVEDVFRKHVGECFDPYGATSCKEVPRCTSVVDFVSKWVLHKHKNDNA
jgi:ribonucleoside-diphosphate reductase alpha chain